MDQKTEKPTPKKLRDARKKGQVVKSKEIVSLIMLTAIAIYFWFFGDTLLEKCKLLFQLPLRYYHEPLDTTTFSILVEGLILIGHILAPLMLTVFVAGIFANVIQTGWLYSTEPIKPELKKIGIPQGFKKIFSTKNLLEFIKSLIKIAMLGFTSWYVLKNDLPVLFSIPDCGVECALPITGLMIMKILVYCLGVFVILAIADYALEHYLHHKQLKMSKDEVKREYKDTEGSPEIKGRRKELHRELMNDETIKKRVSKADVLITNPTHYAVGICYDAEKSPLPFVTIKGEWLLAKRIRRMAENQGIPIIENKPLARGLYAKIEMDQKITSEFIQSVADIIRWLRDKNRSEF